MTHRLQQLTGGFAPRLSLFYAALGLTIGVQLPFFPVWLQARGFEAGVIGALLAAPHILRIASVPLIAREADRRNAVAGALMAVMAVTAAATLALGFTAGNVALVTLYLFAALAFAAVMPLADAYALAGLSRRGRAYGPVRLWASVGFIVANIGAGFLLDLIAPVNLIWALAAVLGVTAVCAFALEPSPPHPVEAAAHPSAGVLWRDKTFLAVVMAASLVQASHAVYYGFSVLDWRTAGYDGLTIGGLWALGVIVEIVLFARSGRLPPAFGPLMLLIVGAAGATIRWTAMVFDPPAVLLPPLQVLHALSFGATHLGAVGFLARAAPARLGATAQGYFSTVAGVTMAGAMAASGWLYGAFGGFAYAAMALMAAAGFGLAFVARASARGQADACVQ